MWDRGINGTKKLFIKVTKEREKAEEKEKKNIFLYSCMIMSYYNSLLHKTNKQNQEKRCT